MAVNGARLAENFALANVVVGLLLAGVLGKLTVDEGEPFDWLLAAAVAGPFVVSAAILGATALILRNRS